MSRKIFISAVSKELRSYRQLVSESLLKRGYIPVDQEIFGLTDQEIVQLLKDRLRPCDAVICLIGERYGAEPSRPLDGFGRRSFTQLEYLFARAMTEPRPKHVSLFLTTGATPVDCATDEAGELRALQRAFRDEVTRDRNWRAFNDANELRAEIAELRFPWERNVRKTGPFLFASYSMKDRAVVLPFVAKLQQFGVSVFHDTDLQPGEDWDTALEDALIQAAGLLVFVSPRSMTSEWVRREIELSSQAAGRLIIPIILEFPKEMPQILKSRQWVDLSKRHLTADLDDAAMRIVDTFRRFQPTSANSALEAKPEEQRAAKEIAADLRSVQPRPEEVSSPPRSVFIAHGHDTEFLADVHTFVTDLSIEPIVLSRIKGASQSLFQKFLRFGKETRFAIVLLSADDFGVSREQYEADGVGVHALQFRARQNAILELGFFYGYLGWERVFVLQKKANKVFPNFERPSDLDGVVFDEVDDAGEWKGLLRARLNDAGFKVW